MTLQNAVTSLMADIEEMRLHLQQYIAQGKGQSEGAIATSSPTPKSTPSTLDELARKLKLTEFERQILLLCVSVELDWQVLRLCAEAQEHLNRTYPTFGLAFALFPELKHWSATKPPAPLRQWELISVRPETTLMTNPLRASEWVVHYLMGETYLPEDLVGVISQLEVEDREFELPPSQQTLVERLQHLWQDEVNLPIVQLCGDRVTGRSVVQRICQRFGRPLYRLSPEFLPVAPDDLDRLLRLWERQAKLTRGVLLLEHEAAAVERDPAKHNATLYWFDRVTSALVVSTSGRLPERHRPLVTFDVPKLSLAEQRQVWQTAIAKTWTDLEPQQLTEGINRLINQFDLSLPAIEAACQGTASQFVEGSPSASQAISALWESCRTLARPQMGDLAQPLEVSATWADLVLPDRCKQILQDTIAQVQHRATVYESWGFAAKSRRGLGATALFYGPSGTGKTMAAEVLARELHLDLYRIDLSSVVSKYIGETEENLRKVFDAAEASGAILLFDEADALFGKRSEVKDSQDRHANIEVSYLLQRMEDYQGLAILTTNLKDALDAAFMRRLRFIVEFPFPDAKQRRHIWQNAFPEQLPTQIDKDKDVRKLAKLNVAGGNIRSVALNAAFLAADDEGRSLTMEHLLRAAQLEALKLERPLTDAEIRGWVVEE